MRHDSIAMANEEDIRQRLRAVVVEKVFSHSTVGEPFTVSHSLGTVPSMVTALPFTDCRVWAEEADRALWNTTRVLLRCSVADAPMSVEIKE